ncbi:hypothetical protein Y032_0056g2702 [Ancylostoma ceylanicum]|uniref:Uncharacterized protein n=1 Tax=Ancylostoma ceylanicum TaxID=53326 RepID=A0A016U5C0_9BILA|nr:hypothetical protein Y032_0056g2702 [Ancylostoma ceylanicum]
MVATRNRTYPLKLTMQLNRVLLIVANAMSVLFYADGCRMTRGTDKEQSFADSTLEDAGPTGPQAIDVLVFQEQCT